MLLTNGTLSVVIQSQACDLDLEGDQGSGTLRDRASDQHPLDCNPACASLQNHPSRTFLLVGRANALQYLIIEFKEWYPVTHSSIQSPWQAVKMSQQASLNLVPALPDFGE